jgi:flagellin-like hook-associated protein FlgL
MTADPFAPPPLRASEFAQIRELAYRRFGLDIKEGKQSLVVTRLSKELRRLGLASFEEYCRHVVSDHSGEALGEMADALTTNFTSFLREQAHFQFLRTELTAQLPRSGPVDIWSAASSSGEEPYSIISRCDPDHQLSRNHVKRRSRKQSCLSKDKNNSPMISGINSEGQNFINAINSIEARLNTAQTQLSSGLTVNQPSDAPDELSPILQLHAQINQNQAMQTNLKSALTTINAAESALSNSVTLLQNALSIATQSTGLSQTADTRATLSQNVQGLLQQMVTNANTTVDGKYAFSGDQNETQLYQLDFSSPTGVNRLAVATSTDLVQAPGGVQINASLTGNTIFDHRNPDDTVAPDNVFSALNGLITALQNNDTVGINTSISSLQTASTYMNDQLAFYGTAQDRIDSGVTAAQNNSVQLQTQLGNLQDANEAASITQLTQAQTQLQEALDAQARIPTTTLFDVLRS